MFPDELKGLTLVEEKLIALNSCYGFVTRYSIPGGQRQSLRYLRHVKGHITVFPNNVQELATKVLPHPLLQVMDEIHVSWQGAEKPGPSDLSSLLSVRRRVVERALVWLKKNNPHYAEIEIDVAEMESWGAPPHGVPSLVYDRMERNEPSAWEKTRTAQVVPPTERAMGDEGSVDIEEILDLLNQGEGPPTCQTGGPVTYEGNEFRCEAGAEADQATKPINEVTSSGMFPLDGPPDVADVEKLRFACDAVGEGAGTGHMGARTWVGSSTERRQRPADDSEPYISVSRGDEFADSFDASFFAKTFPTLLPFGVGGPRLVEEATLEAGRGANMSGADMAARDLLSSRNMSLRTWADIVLRRHGGRFATHHIFAFLVFNMGVRSRNRRVSMLSVTRKNFRKVERIVRSLTADRLGAARTELESSGKTTDDGVKELLRSLSLYGYRQPMSRELRLSMRHKIQALIVRYGVPAIWFTINPNDITNPVKLRLAAYRSRDPEAAEAFLRSLGISFKQEESVFGRISQYYGAVETNERGALHVHGLLWLHGNAHLSSMLADIDREDQAAYRERIVQYVDSVFSEFSAAFDEEANFCAGATQIHTHSPTCVKYSLGKKRRKGNLCRFKAPWRLVDKTAFTPDGVLQIRRTHPMVNRWNKAIAVGLRHNHDISFIATQRKTMALVYYVTNYATKVEDPTWKRAGLIFEQQDFSEHAIAAIRVVQAQGRITAVQCADILMGKRYPPYAAHLSDNWYGMAKSLKKHELIRVIDELSAEKVFDENNHVGNHGMAIQYLKLGATHRLFLSGQRKLMLSIQVSEDGATDSRLVKWPRMSDEGGEGNVQCSGSKKRAGKNWTGGVAKRKCTDSGRTAGSSSTAAKTISSVTNKKMQRKSGIKVMPL
ncbi:Helitron-like-N domain-containing protein [Fusarium keratoplasticum]|nr:Helitron-like-N domain-containing protein [Fusarium keratoplasticum]